MAFTQEAEAERQKMQETVEKNGPNEQPQGLSEEAMRVLSAVDALLAQAEEGGPDRSNGDISYE